MKMKEDIAKAITHSLKIEMNFIFIPFIIILIASGSKLI